MNYEELQEEYAINGHLTFMVALNIAMVHYAVISFLPFP